MDRCEAASAEMRVRGDVQGANPRLMPSKARRNGELLFSAGGDREHLT